jgi:two-component system sensor histidine kinase RegB
LTHETARQNLMLFVQLRWIAAAGQLATILFVEFVMHVRLPLATMFGVLFLFVLGNVLSVLRLRWPRPVSSVGLLLTLTFDALILTALLSLSGGISNPFTLLYLLQAILGVVLLEAWASWTMVLVTFACCLSLTVVYTPLRLPPGGPGLFELYIRGTLVSLALDAVLLVSFMGRIIGNLRNRDLKLAALRQQAAEEEHIVRMGLLASGAAHELGTPLSTIDVILADWRRMPRLASDPELALEIAEMRSEVARCKAIVTDVLLSAGKARAEAMVATSLRRYLREIVEEWRARRAPTEAVYTDDIQDNPRIVADPSLRQALLNILDNAIEASPASVTIRAGIADRMLSITVEDAGPGFNPSMLSEIGRPYVTTKGRTGGGLGLFLVSNVARTLGGTLQAGNRDVGGGRVILSIPLAALEIGHGS